VKRVAISKKKKEKNTGNEKKKGGAQIGIFRKVLVVTTADRKEGERNQRNEKKRAHSNSSFGGKAWTKKKRVDDSQK